MNKLTDSIRDNYTALIVGIESTNIDIKGKYVLYLLNPIKDSNYTLPEDYFNNVIKPKEDQELFLSYVLTADSKTNVYNAARKYISYNNIDILEIRPNDPEINLKPFVEPRQIFSELKSRCHTKRQMKAFNNLINTFAVKPNMAYYGIFKGTVDDYGLIDNLTLIKIEKAYRSSELRDKYKNSDTERYYFPKICDVSKHKKTSKLK